MKKYARLRPSSSSNSEKFEEIDNVLYNSRPEESHMKMNRHHHTSNTCSTSSSSLQHQDSPVVVVAPSSSSSSLPSRVVPPLPASSTTGPSHTDLAEALKKLASFREGGGSTRWQQQQGGGGGSNSLNGLNGNGLNGDGDGESIHSRSVSGRWPGSGEGGWGAPQDVSGSGRWGTADSGSLSGRWGSTSTNDQWDEPTGHPHRSSSYRDTTLSLSRSGRLLQDQQQQQQEGESVWSTGLNFLAGRNSAKKSSSFRESSNLGQGRNNIINTMATGTTSTSNSSSSAHHFGGDLGSGGCGLRSHHLAGGESVQQRKKNNNNNNSINNNNISMRETQGWLATVQRPQPLRSSGTHLASSVSAARISPPNGSRLWEEDPNEFNWKLASTSSTQPSKKAAARTTASQSMRYDRLKATDFAAGFDDEDDEARRGCGASGGFHRNDPLSTTNVMQKAASMREGGAHSDAIMAMARAYSEKHHGGIPPAILECVSCGRGLGVVIVQGNPGIADTSFCQSCRPLPGLSWSYASSKVLEVSKSKRKGMMHYCRKILRMGKKPNNLKFSL